MNSTRCGVYKGTKFLEVKHMNKMREELENISKRGAKVGGADSDDQISTPL